MPAVLNGELDGDLGLTSRRQLVDRQIDLCNNLRFLVARTRPSGQNERLVFSGIWLALPWCQLSQSDPVSVRRFSNGQLLPLPAKGGEVLITAFIVGLLMAAVGSLVPAMRASQVEPVVAMRA